MVLIVVSAPGKIILNGEHSVVYGHKALATSVNLRTSTRLRSASDLIRIELPNLQINESYQIGHIDELFESLNEMAATSRRAGDILSIVQFIRKFLQLDIQFNINSTNAISLIFYVFYCFLKVNSNIEKLSGIEIKIHSEFQIGSGLGSSASYVVSVVGAFLAYFKYLNCQSVEFSVEDLKSINDMALELEKVTHGRPSGIDNTTCTYGQLVLYQNGKFSVLQLCDNLKISIILVNSGVDRNTKFMAESVAKFKETNDELVETIFKSIDGIVNDVVRILNKNCDFDKLGNLMDVNHKLLKMLQVSHPKLEEIYSFVKQCNLSGKLTGAGGGGYFIVLVPSDYDSDAMKQLIRLLHDNGFVSRKVQLGCDGVRIDQFQCDH